jgi:hypothetical protein
VLEVPFIGRRGELRGAGDVASPTKWSFTPSISKQRGREGKRWVQRQFSRGREAVRVAHLLEVRRRGATHGGGRRWHGVGGETLKTSCTSDNCGYSSN